MKTIGFAQVTNPEVAFVLQFEKECELEKGIALAKKGLEAWSAPEYVTNGDFCPEFNPSDANWIYYCGWMEPSITLLDREGIVYKIVDIEMDENGNLINKDCNKEINWILV